jgi:nucleoside-triphosphatase THEP1
MLTRTYLSSTRSARWNVTAAAFVDLVQQLLDGETRVLATVAMKGSGLIQSVKQRQDVDLITVSAGNRDDLVEALVERIARAIL